ncbi:MAG: hypothetical protein QW290_01135 [Sulfolobales archaeon]
MVYNVMKSEWGRVVKESLNLDREKELVLDLVRKVLDGRRHAIVSSVGLFRSVGRYFTQLVNSLTSVSAFYVEPHELTYYIAPYDEGREVDVLIVSTPDGANDLYVLLDQLTLTGHRVALISEPLPEVLKQRFAWVERAEISWGSMGLLKLLSLLAYTASSLSKQELQVRTKRIKEECLTLAEVADDLIERYDRELKAVREALSEPYLITYTPTLEPAAELASLALSKSVAIAVEVPVSYLYVGKISSKVLAFTTDVEVYTVRYYFNKIVEKGGTISEVRLRTDPLTAPLYALLLLYYVAAGN